MNGSLNHSLNQLVQKQIRLVTKHTVYYFGGILATHFFYIYSLTLHETIHNCVVFLHFYISVFFFYYYFICVCISSYGNFWKLRFLVLTTKYKRCFFNLVSRLILVASFVCSTHQLINSYSHITIQFGFVLFSHLPGCFVPQISMLTSSLGLLSSGRSVFYSFATGFNCPFDSRYDSIWMCTATQ